MCTCVNMCEAMGNHCTSLTVKEQLNPLRRHTTWHLNLPDITDRNLLSKSSVLARNMGTVKSIFNMGVWRSDFITDLNIALSFKKSSTVWAFFFFSGAQRKRCQRSVTLPSPSTFNIQTLLSCQQNFREFLWWKLEDSWVTTVRFHVAHKLCHNTVFDGAHKQFFINFQISIHLPDCLLPGSGLLASICWKVGAEATTLNCGYIR